MRVIERGKGVIYVPGPGEEVLFHDQDGNAFPIRFLQKRDLLGKNPQGV